MSKLSIRNERVIKVLKIRLNILKVLAEQTDDETKKNSYIGKSDALSSCIKLLTDDEYLEELQKYYDIK